MTLSVLGIGRFTLVAALVTSLAGFPALADGSLSALPNVGASQALNASQRFSVGGGPPMLGGATSGKGAQSAPHDHTLTITRVANDSARLAASDGLDAFDQTLHVDARGAVAQPSPANPFIDAWDTVAAVLAAAPANPQKGAAWSASVAAPSWIANFMNGTALPKSLSSIPVSVTVASVTGDTMNLRGEGKGEFKMATGMGNETNTVSVVLDCTLRSGQIKSCSRTTTLGLELGAASYSVGETTTLAAK